MLRRRPRITTFQPWMIHKLRQHIAEGWSYNLFASKYHLHPELWQKMGKEIPEIKAIREDYNYYVSKSKSADYWMQRKTGEVK